MAANITQSAREASKQKLLREIQECEKEIEELSKANDSSTLVWEDVSDFDSDFAQLHLNLDLPSNELTKQESMLKTCLQATVELNNLEIIRSEVNVLVEDPVLDGELPVAAEGVWREVIAECSMGHILFTIMFYAHRCEETFAPISYRNLRVIIAKEDQEKELAKSLLPTLRRPSDAIQMLKNYSTAYRTRRSVLSRLKKKYPSMLAFSILPEGGFSVICPDLFEIQWKLQNKRSPVDDFRHRYFFSLEYMEERYIKIIKRLDCQLSDPEIDTEERLSLLTNFINTCIDAKRSLTELKNCITSDPEAVQHLEKIHTIVDQEPEAPAANNIANDVNKRSDDVNKMSNDVHKRANDVHKRANDVHKRANDVNNRPHDVHEQADDGKKKTDNVNKKVANVQKHKVLNVNNKANNDKKVSEVSKKTPESKEKAPENVPDKEIMAPPKSLPKRKVKGKENVNENRNSVKRSSENDNVPLDNAKRTKVSDIDGVQNKDNAVEKGISAIENRVSATDNTNTEANSEANSKNVAPINNKAGKAIPTSKIAVKTKTLKNVKQATLNKPTITKSVIKAKSAIGIPVKIGKNVGSIRNVASLQNNDAGPSNASQSAGSSKNVASLRSNSSIEIISGLKNDMNAKRNGTGNLACKNINANAKVVKNGKVLNKKFFKPVIPGGKIAQKASEQVANIANNNTDPTKQKTAINVNNKPTAGTSAQVPTKNIASKPQNSTKAVEKASNTNVLKKTVANSKPAARPKVDSKVPNPGSSGKNNSGEKGSHIPVMKATGSGLVKKVPLRISPRKLASKGNSATKTT